MFRGAVNADEPRYTGARWNRGRIHEVADTQVLVEDTSESAWPKIHQTLISCTKCTNNFRQFENEAQKVRSYFIGAHDAVHLCHNTEFWCRPCGHFSRDFRRLVGTNQ